GHGVLATIHGENADSVIERLVAPPISIPKNLLSSIWSIIVLENVQGHRRVKFVYEIDKKIRIHEVFRRIPGGNSGYIPRDPVELAKKTIRLAELLDEETLVSELVERASFLDRMVARGIFDLPRLGEELMKFYYEQLGEETVAYIQ
ncbi:MAG: secretion system protein E, partial [Thermoprotei archaeon]